MSERVDGGGSGIPVSKARKAGGNRTKRRPMRRPSENRPMKVLSGRNPA